MNRIPKLALAALLSTPLVTAAATYVPGGERVTLPSKVLGEERTLLVAVPEGYARSTQRYPVLYLTDGETQFAHTAATAAFLARNGFLPETIVVGIVNTDRARDLAPTRDPRFPTSGGADRFLEFLEKELVPYVESTWRTAPFRIFAGHSAGGNFAFHALRTKPELFQAIVAVSPWLVWDDKRGLPPLLRFLAGDGVLTRALYVSSGDEGDEMRDVLAQVEAALRKRAGKGPRWQVARFPGEHHGSVVLPSHYAALKMIFEGYAIPIDPATERLTGSLEEVKGRYADLSRRLGFEMRPPETSVNRLGYQELARRNVPSALAFFRFNAKAYPESPNVHDSLGDGLEASGALEEALASFRRAAELGEKVSDPNTAVFRANAERVRAKLAGKALDAAPPR